MTQDSTKSVSTIVVDLDGTLTHEKGAEAYQDVDPRLDVIERLKSYANSGFRIAIFTSRNMRTHGNSIGVINAKTIPTIIDWLSKHDVPYDELHVGKPWCGPLGFYVDDKAIRPSEFLQFDSEEIRRILRLGEK